MNFRPIYLFCEESDSMLDEAMTRGRCTAHAQIGLGSRVIEASGRCTLRATRLIVESKYNEC
jgi:hypothetical protein